MEKTNINRLLHVFVPFIIMVMTQNLLLLLWDRIGFVSVLGDIIAFVLASAVAVIFFCAKPLARSEDDDSFPHKKSGVTRCTMHLFFCMAMLIISMHLTSLITANYNSTSTEFDLLYIISLILIHPIVEEYIFRGLFYGELRKINPVFGIIAQAIMFAIVHNTIDGMTYALIAGVFLGAAEEKTGRLYVPILAHIFINMRSLLYITLLSDHDALRRVVDISVVSVGVLAFFILLLLKNLRGEKKPADEEVKTEWTEIE